MNKKQIIEKFNITEKEFDSLNRFCEIILNYETEKEEETK